jgi:hypothetical protein
MPTGTLSIYNAPSPVGSIIVNNLQSSSPYVTSFIVEVYGDLALTDLVATQTCPAFWNGTENTQVGAMTFSGLPLANTYYLRAGTCSSHSTVTSWTNAFTANLQVINELESVTYGGTFIATNSGVSYQVRPGGIMVNIDHYEALYTIDNATTPLGTDTPIWKGNTDFTGLFTFGVVAAPGHVVNAYVRAVDTSANYQAWTLISTLTISAGGSFSGTLDNISDGTVYAKTLASGLTSGSPDPRKTTGLVKLGSVNPAWSASLFWSATAFSASGGQVSFWWNQIVVKRVDGSQTVIGAVSSSSPVIVTGLSSSTPTQTIVYDFYPYIDDFLNVISFLSAGGVGTPTYGFFDSSLTADTADTNSQQMNRQDRVGLGPIQISMPIWNGTSGGTAGGGGGVGATCPRGDMLVHCFKRGRIRADEIKPGDRLATPLEFGWSVNVLDVRHEVWSDWLEITTSKGTVVVHPHTHLPVEDSDDCVMAKDLTLSHILHSRTGSARILCVRYIQEEAVRVILTCDKSKVFLCGKDAPDIVIHNVRLANC